MSPTQTWLGPQVAPATPDPRPLHDRQLVGDICHADTHPNLQGALEGLQQEPAD